MKIREAGEMYLETILVLSKRQNKVRMIDIANEMGYSRPTISIFIKDLQKNGYIEIGEGGRISLLDSGRAIAERVYKRHRLLTEFLISIGVCEKVASLDACKMEHDISDETLECIEKAMEKLQ